jgi:hypothetical protein
VFLRGVGWNDVMAGGPSVVAWGRMERRGEVEDALRRVGTTPTALCTGASLYRFRVRSVYLSLKGLRFPYGCAHETLMRAESSKRIIALVLATHGVFHGLATGL